MIHFGSINQCTKGVSTLSLFTFLWQIYTEIRSSSVIAAKFTTFLQSAFCTAVLNIRMYNFWSIEKYRNPPTEWVTNDPKLFPTIQCHAGPYTPSNSCNISTHATEFIDQSFTKTFKDSIKFWITPKIIFNAKVNHVYMIFFMRRQKWLYIDFASIINITSKL